MTVLDQERVDAIKKYLRWNPRGLTISDLSSKLDMNRNLVAKYLDMLLISGQVDMEILGTAKVYFLSHRVPVSAMLEFSSDYVVMFDTEQRIIQVNEPVLKLLNEKRESLVGKKTGELNDPFFGCFPCIEPVKNGQVAEEKITETSCVLNGETRHFKVKQVLTAFEDGGNGVTFIIEDITTKKTFEETVRLSEARYRGIVEDQTEFITRLRPDGTLLFMNDSYARYLGKNPENRSCRHYIPGIIDEDYIGLNKSLQSLDKDNPTLSIECRVTDPSGHIYWNTWTIRALFDDEGTVQEYQGVGRDSTETKAAAAKINNYIKMMEFLSQTGKAFIDMGSDDDIYDYVARQVYSLAPGLLVWVCILDGKNQELIIKGVAGAPYAIDRMQQFTGTRLMDMSFPINESDTAELILKRKLVKTPPLYRLLHMQVPEEICRQIEEAAGGIDSYLMGLVSKGRIVGDVGISLQSGTELPNRELIEAFIRKAAIAIDRKIAEDALKKSERLYRSVINNIRDAFFRADHDGNLVMASPSLASMLGYDTLDECLGRNAAESFYLEPGERKAYIDKVHEYGEVRDHEIVLKKKDGTPVFAAVSSHLFRDGSGDVIGVEGIIRDISERHAVVERIRNHMAQMRFLSRVAWEFVQLDRDADIYEVVGKGMLDLVPDAMVVVNSFDPVTQMVTVKVALPAPEYDTCKEILGLDPVGLQYPMGSVAPGVLLPGNLIKIESDLFQVTFGRLPENACRRIAAELDFSDYYSIGLVTQDLLFGNITLFMRGGAIPENTDLIETYVRQASIALQRRLAEIALKEQEQEAVRNMEFLNRTAMAFVEMDELEDIYRFIAEQIYSLVPDSIVGVNSYDPLSRTLVLRSVVGNLDDVNALEMGVGGPTTGMVFPIDVCPDAEDAFSKKSLLEGPGLFDIFFKNIPEDRCASIEESLGRGKNYVMGFAHQGEIYGSVGINMKKGTELKNRQIIEAFINQAAVALLRRHARSQLRQRVKQNLRNMDFLSRTAMALVDIGDSEDIYRFVTDRIRLFDPDLIVGFNSFDMERGTATLRSISGLDEHTALKLQESGVDLFGITFPLVNDPTAKEVVSQKCLTPGPERLYNLLFAMVPEQACAEIEAMINWGGCYAMGCVCQGEIFGSIVIIVKNGRELENKETLEAFINQAAVALLRRHTRHPLPGC